MKRRKAVQPSHCTTSFPCTSHCILTDALRSGCNSDSLVLHEELEHETEEVFLLNVTQGLLTPNLYSFRWTAVFEIFCSN